MELRQLEYFVAVVETGSFSRAAKRCNITQPSLSQQIIKLEQELEQTLFDRLGRSIVITEVGKLFYPRAMSILSEVQQAKYIITDGYNPEERELAIGIIPTLAPYILSGAVERFQVAYPTASLQILEDTTNTLVDELLNASLDVIFVSLPINNKKIKTIEVFTEPLLVAMNNNNALANVATVNAELLSNLPFIRLTDPNCLADQLDAFCYTQKIDPPVIYRTSNLTTTMELVQSGLGVSLVPACSIPKSDTNLLFKQLDSNTANRVIVAAH
ncbi:MAG: LysR family transcriptional regulator, partial [Chloroflexota bacterium]